jgi:hypothetical protein
LLRERRFEMRPACCGCTPHFFRRHAARVVAVGLLLSLAACASEKSAQLPSAFGDSPAAYTVEVRPPRVQTEDDGLPSQPPPLRRSAGADDPREPWSPNYGTSPATKIAELPAPAPAVASTPAPAETQILTPARVAMVIKERFPLFGDQPIDEDDTIRRAIAAHEMRRED